MRGGVVCGGVSVVRECCRQNRPAREQTIGVSIVNLDVIITISAAIEFTD